MLVNSTLVQRSAILSIFLNIIILCPVLHAQSSDVELNNKYDCRVTDSTSVLVKDGAELTEDEFDTEITKLKKKLRKRKKAIKRARQSGNTKKAAKLNKKKRVIAKLRKSLIACQNGDYQTEAPQDPVPFPVTTRGGTYTGTWNNTTFSSSGGISMTFSITSTNTGDDNKITRAFSMALDLDGNVFGEGDPEAELFEETIQGDPPYSFTFTSTLFGEMTITVDANGDISLNAPNPTSLVVTEYQMAMDFDDDDNSAAITWTLKLMGSDVEGTGSITKADS